MPLTDIPERLRLAESIIRDLPAPQAKTMGAVVLPAAGALLTGLAVRDTRYCGIGRHLSTGGATVTSVLAVCVTDGEKGNPRLTLAHLIESRSAAGEKGDSWLGSVDGRPMLVTERVAELPDPAIAGAPPSDGRAEVYQLEALVPSDKGEALAAVQLSTSFVAEGPQFRRMVIDAARSVSFRPGTVNGAMNSSLRL
ncbi:hypothetical protein IU448_08880 [Nocardia flavorosea]|nr:hypothetical protein [Nocardia flavorosea]